MKTFITSDTHFNDERVRKLSRKEFETVKEHDEKIIANLEKLDLKPVDKVYFLGDFGNLKGEFKKRFKKLKFEKILLRGNHDNETEEFYKGQGIDKVIDKPFFFENQVLFSHEPQPVNTDYILNLHGDLHGEVIQDDNFINVSVDVNFYKPLELETVVKRKENLKRVRTRDYEKRWHKGKTRKFC